MNALCHEWPIVQNKNVCLLQYDSPIIVYSKQQQQQQQQQQRAAFSRVVVDKNSGIPANPIRPS